MAVNMTIVGITMPFYPMRPTKGLKVTKANVRQLFADITSGQHLAQKKLNGDRACLGVVDGRVVVINRRNEFLKHPVDNVKDFSRLPSGTLLDGEVWQKGFYPFEALAVGGTSFLSEGPHVREQEAMKISKHLGHVWLFTPPTLEWLEQLDANLPTWEGVVLKRAKSPYIMPGGENQESPMWTKRKW
jgi:ATP-dependent DNA ligase